MPTLEHFAGLGSTRVVLRGPEAAVRSEVWPVLAAMHALVDAVSVATVPDQAPNGRSAGEARPVGSARPVAPGVGAASEETRLRRAPADGAHRHVRRPAAGVLAGGATARIDAVSDSLEFAVPDDSEPRLPEGSTVRTAQSMTDQPRRLHALRPWVVGPCNPLGPPRSTLWFDPPVARGRPVHPDLYEGCAGVVHGAALAAAFDIILTAANVLADAAGPTVELTIRYAGPR